MTSQSVLTGSLLYSVLVGSFIGIPGTQPLLSLVTHYLGQAIVFTVAATKAAVPQPCLTAAY